MCVTSHKGFAERQHQKVVSIPELRYPVNTIFVLVEGGKMVHEIFLVEKVEYLPAMKFGSVDEVHSIVGCRKRLCVWSRGLP